MYKRDVLALKINEFVLNNGTETIMNADDILSLAELYTAGLRLTDYCYNYTNKQIGDSYTSMYHLFEYVSQNRFRILGENFPYTGDVIEYSRGGKHIVGNWSNGVYMPIIRTIS